MLPVPDCNQSLNNLIDSLESKQILSLLGLWDKKSDLEELTGILYCLKDKFKISTTIDEYYYNAIRRENEILQQSVYNDIKKTYNKRSRYLTNCGSSQCEFRFNGCNYSP